MPCLLAAAAVGLASTAVAAVASLQGADPRTWWLAVAGGLVAMGVGWVAAPLVPGGRGLVLVLVVAALLRVALVPTPPVLSDDAYRYLWDGRVLAAGLDPYAEAPISPERAELRDGVVWPYINRKSQPTIYPPLAQGVFGAANLVGLRTPTAWKALTATADLAACALLALALRRSGRDPRLVVAYAWNPLPVLAFAHSGHVDALVVLACAGAVVAWQAGRGRTVGLLIGAAAAVKLFPLVLAAAFLRDRDGRLRPWQVGGVAVAVLAVSYLPALVAGADPLGYLTAGYFDEEGYSSGARFVLLRRLGLAGGVGPVPVVALVVAAAVGIAVLRSHQPAAVRGAWLLGAALALTTPYPWYAAPLVALAVAGGGGWLWPLFGIALDVAYLGLLLESGFPDSEIRAAAALAVVVLGAAAVAPRLGRSAVGT